MPLQPRRPTLRVRSRWLRPLVFWAVLSGLGFLWAAMGTEAATLSTLRFLTLGSVPLPSRWVFAACGGVSLIVGVLGGMGVAPAGMRPASLVLVPCALVSGVLVWASMQRQIEVLGMVTQSLRLATPIALGALAGILCERSGVINIALEGMMLAAACLGFTAALYSDSVGLGVLAAMLTGMLMAALHAVLTIHGRVDHIISGTVLNILAIGFTGFIRRSFLLQHPHSAPAVLPSWPLPGLAEVPILGAVLFRHQPLVYSMAILVVVVHVLLYHTPWGLRTRAIGEHPQAAHTLGVHVVRLRYYNVIASGILAGLGGAWFSLETVGTFEDLMTGGKGFIALAAVVFGRWRPLQALGSAVLFGFADALQIKLQIAGVDVPYQLLNMLPYVVTMVVLAGVIGRAVPPAAAGRPGP